jgi:hypothetical protein
VLDAHADFIFGAVAEALDTTLDEMVERFARGTLRYDREDCGLEVPRPARPDA